MRTKKSSKSNMRFLKGNVIFFALLLLVILLFVYYAVIDMDPKSENNASRKIYFAESYNGGRCKVFVGDSLLYSGAPLRTDSMLVMRRYAGDDDKKSLYTSETQLKVVTGMDTIVRVFGGDELFAIGSRDGKVVIDAVEKK
jgi:hypothetical protein